MALGGRGVARGWTAGGLGIYVVKYTTVGIGPIFVVVRGDIREKSV